MYLETITQKWVIQYYVKLFIKNIIKLTERILNEIHRPVILRYIISLSVGVQPFLSYLKLTLLIDGLHFKPHIHNMRPEVIALFFSHSFLCPLVITSFFIKNFKKITHSNFKNPVSSVVVKNMPGILQKTAARRK